MSAPNAAQVFAAKVRAAAEEYKRQRRKPMGGGYVVPPSEEVNTYLSEQFGIAPADVSFFFTYSRYCNHKWSEGACDQCPFPATYNGVYQ